MKNKKHYLKSITATGIICLCLFTRVFAQAPGGVTGANMWVAANNTGITSGGLSQWNNLANAAANFTQATPANQPTASATSNFINFNPSISFNGTNNFLRASTNLFSLTTNSVFAVGVRPTTGSYIDLVSVGGGAGFGFEFRLNPSNTLAFITNGGISSTTAFPLAIPFLGSGTQNNNNLTVFYNGAANGTGTSTGTLTSQTATAIGYNIALASSNFFYNGLIAEEIVYPSVLSSFKQKQVWSYLALKYGITLSQSTSPGQSYWASDGTTKMWDSAGTFTSGFNNNIFGIGRDDGSALNQKVSASVNTNSFFTIALDSDYTSNNQAASRTKVFAANKTFITLADNAGTLAFGNTNLPPTAGASRINRSWQMQATGTAATDSIYIAFPASSLTGVASNASLYIVTSAAANNNNFKIMPYAGIKMKLNAANYYWAKIPAASQYITIAQVAKTPMRHGKQFVFGKLQPDNN